MYGDFYQAYIFSFIVGMSNCIIEPSLPPFLFSFFPSILPHFFLSFLFPFPPYLLYFLCVPFANSNLLILKFVLGEAFKEIDIHVVSYCLLMFI